MSEIVFRVGGVPEHFNYPWQHAPTDRRELPFEWKDFPGGTGAMLEALDHKELDVALLLTEGAVAGIFAGVEARIIGTYVISPLLWGIHVHPGSRFSEPHQLQEAVFAISRKNSGSHLMAYAMAHAYNWDPARLRFEIVGNFDGAQQALDEGRADVFLWEKYTTKPTVDAGRMKRIGVQPTPWPCFVLVAREDVIRDHSPQLQQLMTFVRRRLHAMEEKDTMQYISDRYRLDLGDVREWFAQTRWLCRPRIARQSLADVQALLLEMGVLQQERPLEDLVAPFCLLLDQQLSPQMYRWRVESVYRALAEKGRSCGPLEMDHLLELGHLDQYHYHGAELSHQLVDDLGLSPEKDVLDIGSGVGGTARVLAHESGCRVVGVEVQAELNELADELTQRVGLSDHIHYITGKAEDLPFEAEFDHFISLLVYLHIPARRQALGKAFRALKPGGTFIIEDFVLEAPLSQAERAALQEVVSGQTVSTISDYLADLEEAGFDAVQVESRTEAWRRWTADRYQAFAADRDRQVQIFGEELVDSRTRFYRTVAELFEGGRLGGVRIHGRKP